MFQPTLPSRSPRRSGVCGSCICSARGWTLIDRRAVKPILIFVAAGQPVFLGLMVMQQDYILFVVTLLAMGFIFGQIPITDAVYPAMCRSMEPGTFGQIMLNLLIGASALATARWMLSGGAGFEGVIQVLALAACLIVAAALVLPSRSSSSVLAPAAS